ncbi:MAG: hypothetical protein BMS9Abin10_0706 [Gammaproteobacteria bacterium]|nr:MAG: hypothetical protein BMS9Abin10_0706 [Gammaproteobacteria bacterium]
MTTVVFEGYCLCDAATLLPGLRYRLQLPAQRVPPGGSMWPLPAWTIRANWPRAVTFGPAVGYADRVLENCYQHLAGPSSPMGLGIMPSTVAALRSDGGAAAAGRTSGRRVYPPITALIS